MKTRRCTLRLRSGQAPSVFLASIVLLALLVPGGARPTAAQPQPASPVALDPVPDRAQVTAALQSAPAMFIENVGQFDDGARFQMRGGDRTLWLAEDAIWVTMVEQPGKETRRQGDRETFSGSSPYLASPSPQGGINLKLSFVGANPHPCLEPFNRLDTHVSYLVGDNPAQWHADAPVWGGVHYVDLYPGVDLEVTSEGGHWAWRLACAANCQFALQDLRLRVEGADALAMDGDRLRLSTAVGDFTLPLLAVEGTMPDSQPATSNMERGAFEVSFPFSSAPLFPSTPVPSLSLSPQDNPGDLLYSTFLGGSSSDYGNGIAVDDAGNAYVTGYTWSANFPTTTGALDTSYNGGNTDAFVVKVNASGTDLTYATFLGGGSGLIDEGYAIAVDGAGSAYVTGYTNSSDFPTTEGAFDTIYGDVWCGEGMFSWRCYDAFVVKLNATGSALVYATFLGGSSEEGDDVGYAIAVDGMGSAYVVGGTCSSDFPTTTGAFDTTYNGSPYTSSYHGDAFVVKVNASGTDLTYATFLGGSGQDESHAVTVDEAGSAYVTGRTASSDFPATAGALDTSYDGGGDVFVVKVNADGTGLTYATFLGENGNEYGYAIAVDGAGSAYVTGETNSPGFPTTVGAFDTSYNGSGDEDAFAAKVNPAGNGQSDLVYATFLGGDDDDSGRGIAVDGAGSAYVTGGTWSANFPTTAGAFDTTCGTDGNCNYDGDRRYPDAFVVKVNADGTDLTYATFLGGNEDDCYHHCAIAVDGAGSAYVTGETGSYDFPATAGAFDTFYNGGYEDAFAAKLVMGDEPVPTPTLYAISNADGDGNYTVDWQSVTGASTYTLEEDNNASFTSPTTRYSGSDSQYAVSGQTTGTWYYRVKASNAGGDSPWSNTESVSVKPAAPTLYAISNPDGDGNYTVDWSDVTGASTYTLEEDDNADFTSPTTCYSGSNSQHAVSGQTTGIWYYRVKASNAAGDSSWSNVQSVVVQSSRDPYEPDDTCAQASVLTTDGTAQQHTFHQHEDFDWAHFTVVSGTTYVVQATSISSDADLMLELYDACGGNLEGSDDNVFGNDARLIFTAPSSGIYYVKALNQDPDVYGPDVTYELSVRAQIAGAAAIIVAGHNDAWQLQNNIDHCTNSAYRSFLLAGIPESKLYYLNPNPGLQDPDEDSVYDDVDAVSTAANLQYALETWTTGQVGDDGQLFVYLMDHGAVDAFATDGEGDVTTPQMLDTWLHTVEDATGCRVNVIIEACHSGSFIDRVPDVAQEISEPGRVVIASTGRQQNAYPSSQGAYFSDAFWTSIQNSSNLWVAFQDAVEAVEKTDLWQTPWLDDNGNTTPNDTTDGQVAAGRGLASFFGGRPPVVDVVTVTLTTNGEGTIQAKVRDDYGIGAVWAVVVPPSFQEPLPDQSFEWPDLDLPTVELLDSGGMYQRTYSGFDEAGVYRVIVYARDLDGNQAVPVADLVRAGYAVYLPLIVK